MARAELQENPRANEAVRKFAKIPLDNAEAGCHELFKQLGFCAPVWDWDILGVKIDMFAYVALQ